MFSFVMSFFIFALLVPGIVFMILGIKSGGTKRTLAIIAASVITFIAFSAGWKIYYDYNHTIGTFNGTEYDTITIEGVTYKADNSHAYSGSDKDKLLGKVVFSGPYENDVDPMYVWSIDGTDEYIYAVWVYDGQIFKKV